ncbi:MAG: helix-turn-helix transcriptional regulator [Muribaculaceae bacterium]|nr:helix-turn-helix transcriptional regulator [Muribaculaceae bacterium]
MIISNNILATPDVVRTFGIRFREYRLRLKMTRAEVSAVSGIGMTTLYKFESGNMVDISFRTLYRLLRVIGLDDSWENILPELEESPYLYKKGKKVQRVRHSK